MERAGRRGTCRDQGSLHLPVVYTRQPQARSALDAAGLAETLLVAAGGVSDGRGLAAALALGAGKCRNELEDKRPDEAIGHRPQAISHKA